MEHIYIHTSLLTALLDRHHFRMEARLHDAILTWCLDGNSKVAAQRIQQLLSANDHFYQILTHSLNFRIRAREKELRLMAKFLLREKFDHHEYYMPYLIHTRTKEELQGILSDALRRAKAFEDYLKAQCVSKMHIIIYRTLRYYFIQSNVDADPFGFAPYSMN